ncbi:hypothetical protein TCAL_08715 [Tigriopus californicus]|uniref:Ubiquitin thioesterase OTU n=1 Tax=Tigriopus californicus TaxID=6832 RepID=A0A553P0S2_TIGCA|nr:ubiquitin thioesterase OTU1-like [Tigriopus californicus]TRY71212.1 hypothetical protein TCAL_08715 [Tigriopus californicus]|eukprot:TCALIF_08715-PA protein Name:"Similar to YOD1 Ubiquitin thioesterase OTU1 (Gallus gallus)" AED:0.00 eAED:0.00 QI:0/-1/0/1/-1/1/1/0/296
MAMTKFQIRVKTPGGPKVLSDLSAQSTIQDLLLASDIPVRSGSELSGVRLLHGFPPKSLSMDRLEQTLQSLSIRHGDSLIVEYQAVPGNDDPLLEYEGVLLRQVVPANNSCLFTSINFCLSGQLDLSKADFMREVISAAVSGDPNKYTSAILGKDNADYCRWIRDADSWGGAIEAQILAEYFGVVITVVDIQSDFQTHFGEAIGSSQRMVLIYDGIHYDPLYRDVGGGDKQTLFSLSDSKALKEATVLAAVAKTARQFTDVANFTLRCLVCQTRLKGQTDAQSHAKETGHTNFGEV